MISSNHRCGGAARLAVLLFLGMALRLAAKDFWESTPPSEWKEEETMKMLTDSPWARTVSVLAGTLGAGQAAQWMTDLPSLSTTGGGRDTTSSMTGVAGGTSFGKNDLAPLYITWFSSGKIQQALEREAELRRSSSPYVVSLKSDSSGSQTPGSKAKRFVAPPTGDYQIAIHGPVMHSFNDVSWNDLRLKTFLSSKKNRSKRISLNGYIAPKDRTDRMAVFSFERQINGKPVFGLEDQEVEFSADGKKIFLKTSFKLKQMMLGADLDL